MASGQRRKAARGLSPTGMALVGGGLVALIVGFAAGLGRDGDAATAWGVLAGVGFAVTFVGLVRLWIDHEARTAGDDPGGQVKLERLQAQRSRMLWVFPIVAAVFLFQGTRGAFNLIAGRGEFSDYVSVLLPVLYAWVVAMIVMGWDAHTRKNRRFLEDELTQVIRARAMTAAAIVLMAGLTIALGLGLWRPETGVVAIPFALIAGGATAGIRFAWLDRQAGADG